MLFANEVFQWSEWQDHLGCWKGSLILAAPGLYRIRRAGRDDLNYIGQTGSGGMTLKARLGMLSGVYGEEMPYRAPHTAGPSLGALRHSGSCSFAVSVMPVEGDTPRRKGLECLAIGLYRQGHGQSPTVNFGRIPAGYKISSSNDAGLVLANKRFRGGPTTEVGSAHSPGIAPYGPLTGQPQDQGWGGHNWSDWMAVTEAVSPLNKTLNSSTPIND